MAARTLWRFYRPADGHDVCRGSHDDRPLADLSSRAAPPQAGPLGKGTGKPRLPFGRPPVGGLRSRMDEGGVRGPGHPAACRARESRGRVHPYLQGVVDERRSGVPRRLRGFLGHHVRAEAGAETASSHPDRRRKSAGDATYRPIRRWLAAHGPQEHGRRPPRSRSIHWSDCRPISGSFTISRRRRTGIRQPSP